MTPSLHEHCWPHERLHEAVEGLARAIGRPASSIPRPPVDTQLAGVMNRWLDLAALITGLESESVDVTLDSLEEFLVTTKSALLALTIEARQVYFVVVRGGKKTVRLLGPDQLVVSVPTRRLRDYVVSLRIEALRVANRQLLPEVPLSERRTKLLHDRLLTMLGGTHPVGLTWLLRPPPGEPFVSQLRQTGLFSGLGLVLLLGFVQAALSAASWLVFGLQSLQGHLDRGRLAAWALLLLAAVPIQVWNSWLLGELAIRTSAPFKRRIVDGALRMPADVIRRDGVGALLARVNESVALEGVLVTGGLTAIGAVGDWFLAALLLSQSAFPGLALSVFLLFTIAVSVLGYVSYRRLDKWTASRLEMSTALVERLVGHRTRVIQERRHKWHDAEDRLLHGYAGVSDRMDSIGVLAASFPRLLPIMGAIVVAPIILGNTQGQTGTLLLALVGVAAAASALGSLTAIFSLIGRALVAWRSVGEIFQASQPDRKKGIVQAFANPLTQTRTQASDVLLEARDVSFRYDQRPRPVLDRCSVTVRRGDRILLEGESGGGKSTLASLFAGLRSPESGLLLVKGLDRHSLSAQQWHGAVAIAPQFHENHIFANSLAFNLLLGRAWPPSAGELSEARAVCDELGLGALLGRMPAGLFENIGETGWQLSHGEKSRVYVARAILQRSDVMIFDESFAALDPDTMEQVIRCVLKRAPTLLVIAHP